MLRDLDPAMRQTSGYRGQNHVRRHRQRDGLPAKKMAYYSDGDKANYVSASRIINGTDGAKTIAG
ncbi:hypothetical protein U8C39_12735 (plasmid) [Sinorhizobium meliloti]|nr:hypothetical protein U8C39_12735 [Sinorhizobium meliloti]